MSIFASILLICILFYFLGRAADHLVANLKVIAQRLGIDISFLGFLLGFFTSFPELSISINSSIRGVSDIALGTLLGGIPVLFGLVLGLNIVFYRIISTRVARRPIALIGISMLLPLMLSVDGVLSAMDGVILAIAYLTLLLLLFVEAKPRRAPLVRVFWHADISKPVFMIIAAVLAIAGLANLIVRFTSELLQIVPVPAFLVGLILFAVGTNLPEIIISLRAYRGHQEELSLSNIIGSAMANIVILGLMAMIRPVPVLVGSEFVFLSVIFSLMMGALVFSYRTSGKFTRSEGFILLSLYALFIFGQALIPLIDASL